jgi:hypothetical protein
MSLSPAFLRLELWSPVDLGQVIARELEGACQLRLWI